MKKTIGKLVLNRSAVRVLNADDVVTMVGGAESTTPGGTICSCNTKSQCGTQLSSCCSGESWCTCTVPCQ